MHHTLCCLTLSLLAGLASATATAAWPAPSDNLLVADRGGEETQAKILPRSDGGFYVSWFDNTDGGYDLRLQRLGADGSELWPHGGVLVADRSYQSTTDYGFSVDTAGNALLSFQCCTQNAADERIVVAKVGPDGSLLWGGAPVAVSTAGEGEIISYITATSDGAAVAVWMNDSGAGRAQKLSADGLPLWGATGVSLPGPATGLKFVADVIAAGNGDAIVSWSNQAGSTRILRAQKLAAADGAALWGTDGVRLADSGNLQAGYFPRMLGDGSGGLVYAWHDFIGTQTFLRVQRLAADGTRLYGASGVQATINTTRSHLAPAASFDPASGDTYVFWIDRQSITPDTYEGLYMQRIDSTGARRWGDEARELQPLAVATSGANALSQLVALPAPGGFLASWVTGNAAVADNRISTQRVDAEGLLAWSQAAHIKTSLTHTSRLAGATSTQGYAAFTWSDAPDNDSASQNVRAQNLGYSEGAGDLLFQDGFDN